MCGVLCWSFINSAKSWFFLCFVYFVCVCLCVRNGWFHFPFAYFIRHLCHYYRSSTIAAYNSWASHSYILASFGQIIVANRTITTLNNFFSTSLLLLFCVLFQLFSCWYFLFLCLYCILFLWFVADNWLHSWFAIILHMCLLSIPPCRFFLSILHGFFLLASDASLNSIKFNDKFF